MEVKTHTIIFATPDNDEEMRKFYADVLGFEENENGGYENGGLVVFFDRHNQAAAKPPEPFRVMVTMTVDDIHQTYEDLKSKGVNFVRTPEAEEWGGLFATFEDPDGNYLQIFQMGPQGAHH